MVSRSVFLMERQRGAAGPHHSSHGEQVGVVAALLQVHHDVEQRNLVPPSFGV